MKELTFLVHEAQEGGYYAEAVGVGIFAEGETTNDLKKSIESGIECYYENTEDAMSLKTYEVFKTSQI
jgi:hypothetical protein